MKLTNFGLPNPQMQTQPISPTMMHITEKIIQMSKPMEGSCEIPLLSATAKDETVEPTPVTNTIKNFQKLE
jgi:hypothetical protein